MSTINIANPAPAPPAPVAIEDDADVDAAGFAMFGVGFELF